MHKRSVRLIAALSTIAAVLLVLGLVFGHPDANGRNRLPLPLRMLSSALVWLTALLVARQRAGDTRLVAAGMGCGFLGDLMMARVIPLPQHVAFGMLAFGAGHACYISAFNQRFATPSPGTAGRLARILPMGAAWSVAIGGWLGLVRNPQLNPALNYGALAYALLLASMAGSGAALALNRPDYLPVAGGGALFLVSDIILASELFRGTHFPQIGDVVWLTYITGQGLIVGGMGLVE